jgi:spermidine/putrescine transport system permease protein
VAAAWTDRHDARRKGAGFWLLFLPPFAWMSLIYLVPLLMLLSYAFMRHEYVHVIREFTLENFAAIFGIGQEVNVGYRNTLLRTFYVANLVTLIDTLLALPVAYFLAFHAGRFKRVLTILVLVPLWSSYLVRVFAWRIILGYSGVLNKVLLLLGVLKEPSPLFLYNQFAIVLTLCYIWLPFMVLPLVTAFERLPRRLLEASSDLGAGPLSTFRRVALPLLMPGVLAGGLSVFSLTMGDYITPQMVGGSGGIMVGNLVASQFGVAANWPLGSAFAVIVLLIIFALMAAISRKGALENL